MIKSAALILSSLIVYDAPKQTFLGFGASQPTDQQRLFDVYGPDKVKTLSDRVYKDLGMKWVRLWVHVGADTTVDDMKQEFYAGYINNGYLDILKSSGVTKILLAPDLGDSQAIPDETMAVHASKIAEFIADIYLEQGIKVNVTGIANEPGGFTPNQIKNAVRRLRKYDSTIGIIAPESASPDDSAIDDINAIKADTSAWLALKGIATHSYNMGANHVIENTILGTGKQYWMTEAGKFYENGTDEQPGNTAEASTVAARFLNDMNHSVTHWFWFIGIGDYDRHPNNDSGQVLARPNDSTGGIKYNTKYHYLKQMRSVFNTGAVFYNITNLSGTDEYEKRMNWRYGQKPAITAAMAKNPDGSWGIGIVNTTGLPDDGEDALFYPAETHQVSIRVPSAAFGLQFKSSLGEILAVDVNCKINVSVKPMQLITLKSL